MSVRPTTAGLGARAGVLGLAGAALVLASVVPASAASTLAKTVANTYQTNGRVEAILTIGNTVYVGGNFTSVRPFGDALGKGEVARQHLAAFSRTTGALLAWNPNANKEVYALAASTDGATVYIGGLFSQVGGKTRAKAAAVSASTGALTAWAPTLNNKVLAIAVSSTRVYLGGTFTTANGVARSEIASVTTAGVLDSAFNPKPSDRVRALALSTDGTKVYAGGDFLSVNGDTKQKHMVSLLATTGAVQAWSWHPGYPVYSFAVTSTRLFIGGNGSGGHVGGYALPAGSRSWEVQTDGGVQALAVIGTVLYVGGHFDNVCSSEAIGGGTNGFECPTSIAIRHKLLALDVTAGALDPWGPGANSPLGVFALSQGSGSLSAGGDFTKIGKPDALGQATQAQQGYGRFN
jgi:hypothetical protein